MPNLLETLVNDYNSESEKVHDSFMNIYNIDSLII